MKKRVQRNGLDHLDLKRSLIVLRFVPPFLLVCRKEDKQVLAHLEYP